MPHSTPKMETTRAQTVTGGMLMLCAPGRPHLPPNGNQGGVLGCVLTMGEKHGTFMHSFSNLSLRSCILLYERILTQLLQLKQRNLWHVNGDQRMHKTGSLKLVASDTKVVRLLPYWYHTMMQSGTVCVNTRADTCTITIVTTCFELSHR
jgi:hypothetical protein